jgi:serine/threonine protein kinase
MHRDLKIENILLDPTEDFSYSVKIIDWGFATNYEKKNN